SGTLISSAAFSNSAGGVIAANIPGGTLSVSNLSSNNGVINVGPASTLSVTGSNPWTNAGAINLQGAGSRLTGAAIVNAGMIQGIGTVGAGVKRRGKGGPIPAAGGGANFPRLKSSYGNDNQAPGPRRANGSVLARPRKSGTITLTGGAFDTNSHAMTNGGSIN